MVIQIGNEYVDVSDIRRISKITNSEGYGSSEFIVHFAGGQTSIRMYYSYWAMYLALNPRSKDDTTPSEDCSAEEKALYYRATRELISGLRDELAIFWDEPESRDKIPNFSVDAYVEKYRLGLEKIVNGLR